jgi:hypothetical protein
MLQVCNPRIHIYVGLGSADRLGSFTPSCRLPTRESRVPDYQACELKLLHRALESICLRLANTIVLLRRHGIQRHRSVHLGLVYPQIYDRCTPQKLHLCDYGDAQAMAVELFPCRNGTSR